MKLLSYWDIKDIGENEGELRMTEIVSMYLVWCKRQPKLIKKSLLKTIPAWSSVYCLNFYHIDKNFAHENCLNI